jgi:transcription elongation factor Elf1
MKDIVSNCFLCEEHSLHVAGIEESQIMQCINCGYVTSTKYMGPKETNEEYKKLPDEMKKWSKWENNRTWIPTIMTLPIGMLYPFDNEDGEMKWGFAPMVDIPEDEKENYPDENGGFYKKRIDMDNPKVYDKFVDCMIHANKEMKMATKNLNDVEVSNLPTLPKLKKI